MVKKITLSADEALIRRAREKAAREGRTLNSAFRDWLEKYVKQKAAVEEYDKLMRRFSYVRPGRKFSRGELAEEQEREKEIFRRRRGRLNRQAAALAKEQSKP
jgi:hypothetical protein